MEIKLNQISKEAIKMSVEPFIHEQTQQEKVVFTLNEKEFVCEIVCAKKPSYGYVAENSSQMDKKQTANGEVSVSGELKPIFAQWVWEVKTKFLVQPNEILTGLGQHENGCFNYHGKTEYLYQNNMMISTPVLVSSEGYVVFFDAECVAVFDSGEEWCGFTFDSVLHLNIYVLKCDTVERAVSLLYKLTGMPKMLPQWAFGYMQSAERYKSSEELVEVAQRFQKEKIPLSALVQDWYTWKENLWGDKHPDSERYPDVAQLMNTLHDMGIKLLVSVWPNMAEGGKDYAEFLEKGWFLPNSNVYDAFCEEAGKLYFDQCNAEWFSGGVDGFWCDNTEPFSDADWNGEKKRTDLERYCVVKELSQKSMDSTKLNSFALYHAKNIYQNWRNLSEKRVVNLSRSAYIGAQQYGVIVWSGDISANYETMKHQIVEGIKISMCGFPFWTLDIGGFFTVREKWKNRGCNCHTNPEPLWFWDGDYEDGVEDLGYRELYVRWLQFGCFLPVFRSHGTDTPREPWRFGKKGERFYDVIVDFIYLRYRLMPYIYSTAAQSCMQGVPMMRSLMAEFGILEEEANCSGYMFGDAFYVQPVTRPMYYGRNSKKLEENEMIEVCLPRVAGWYNWFDSGFHEGGERLRRRCPLEEIPLYVRAGSIVPTEEGSEIVLNVFAGADADFPLYFDEGDNYSYQKGNYSLIQLHYCEADQALRVVEVKGKYMPNKQFKVRLIGKEGILYENRFDLY